MVNQGLSKDEKDLSTERQGYNSFTSKSSQAMFFALGVLTVVAGHHTGIKVWGG